MELDTTLYVNIHITCAKHTGKHTHTHIYMEKVYLYKSNGVWLYIDIFNLTFIARVVETKILNIYMCVVW